MKLFNSLQELWNYCSFCPVCRKNCRDIEVSVGPDKTFELEKFEKSSSHLRMLCAFHNKQNLYIVEYRLNCLDNSFTAEVTNVQVGSWFGAFDSCPAKNKLLDERTIKEEYFFFYIQSSCKECHDSQAYSADLDLDTSTGKVSLIGLERESYYLLQPKDKFHITLLHDKNVMLTTRCYFSIDGDLVENEKTIVLPLVKLDLSNQEKAADKIKTLILFS